MDDRLGSIREEPLVLQSRPNVSAFDRMIVLSTFVGIPILAVAEIWRLQTDAPAIGHSSQTKESGNDIQEFCCCHLQS